MNKKSLRVFEFRDSYVLYMFYRYEHYMSISYMALIVAIVQHYYVHSWTNTLRKGMNPNILLDMS